MGFFPYKVRPAPPRGGNGHGAEETMGAIYVKATLTNAADEELARQGRLPAEKVRSVQVDAFVDTGAVHPVVPRDVVESLGLSIIGKADAEFADGREQEVDVTSPVTVELMDRRTTEEAVVLGGEVIIGQTILEKTDLVADCRNQCLIQNPKHPNGPRVRL